MSGYQYYEFQIIDRPFTDKERSEINSWSSRATADSHKVVFLYNYGDFKQNVEQVVWDYFDIGLYISNYGSRRLLLRFPKELVDYQHLRIYCMANMHDYGENELRILQRGAYVLIDICFQEEPGYWVEGEGWLSELIALRKDIIQGDYRSLFMVWIHLIQQEYLADELEDDFEMPLRLIPPNLKLRNQSLDSLIEFLSLEEDWLAAAVELSKDESKQELDYVAHLNLLSSEQKDDYLKRLIEGEVNLGLKLKKELEKELKTKEVKTIDESEDYLSLEDFLDLVEQAAAKQAKADALEKARLHEQKMQKIQKEKGHVEFMVERNILKNNADYEAATNLLIDLRDLAIYEQKEEAFQVYLNELKEHHKRKKKLIGMLKDKGLIV